MNESKGFEGRPQRTVDMSFTPARPAPLSAAEAAGATDAQAIDLPTEAPSVELLRYYKRRIEEFEAERELFLTRFQEVQVSHEELHRVKWELKVREEEIHELQKALSDANVYLYDEREQVLKLQAENDQLKIQELEDRRRIQHLLALTQPVTQEVTFFRDCRPESLSRYPGNEGGGNDGASSAAGRGRGSRAGVRQPATTAGRRGRAAGGDGSFGRTGFAVREAADAAVDQVHGGAAGGAAAVHRGGASADFGPAAGTGAGARVVSGTGVGGKRGPGIRGAGRGRPAGTAAPGSGTAQVESGTGKGAPNRVLRTVYLPSERADALLMTVQSLQQQLAETKRLMEDRVQTWRRDRKEREEAWRNRVSADAMRIASLEKEVASSNTKLHAGTREYLALRHQNQVESRQLREKAAVLEAEHNNMAQAVKETQIKAAEEIAQIREQANVESDHLTSHNRLIARQREDDLAILKEQYMKVQQMYSARVKALEEKLTALRKKYKGLEKRRNMELEGFTLDVGNMRRQLREVSSQLMDPALLDLQERQMLGGPGSRAGDGGSTVSRDTSPRSGGGENGSGGGGGSRMRATGRQGSALRERNPSAGVFGFHSNLQRQSKAKKGRAGSRGKRSVGKHKTRGAHTPARRTGRATGPVGMQPPPPPPPHAAPTTAHDERHTQPQGSVVPPVEDPRVPVGGSDHLRGTISKLQDDLQRLESQLAATSL